MVIWYSCNPVFWQSGWWFSKLFMFNPKKKGWWYQLSNISFALMGQFTTLDPQVEEIDIVKATASAAAHSSFLIELSLWVLKWTMDDNGVFNTDVMCVYNYIIYIYGTHYIARTICNIVDLVIQHSYGNLSIRKWILMKKMYPVEILVEMNMSMAISGS